MVITDLSKYRNWKVDKERKLENQLQFDLIYYFKINSVGCHQDFSAGLLVDSYNLLQFLSK